MRNTSFKHQVLVVAIGALALIVTPLALASGGGKPKAAPSVTMSPGPYSFGQAITVSANGLVYPDNEGPFIEMKCLQNGVVVGTSDEAGFPGGLDYGTPFYLGPSASWTGGAADCTVTVFHLSNNKMVADATTSFHVNG